MRGGDLPVELVDALRSVARRVALGRHLPPGYSPYGRWDQEAADEIFASWYADRLVAEGRLLALLDRAPDVASLNRHAERSLRQHLVNSHDRSQARNLYARVVALLAGASETYRLAQDSSRPQHRWYALADSPHDPAPWAGPARLLLAHAWALGDFTVMRYRADAGKLSPVLDTKELERFVSGLMHRTGTALNPTLIMEALAARFDLGDVELATDEQLQLVPSSAAPADSDLSLTQTAEALLRQLSTRQTVILRLSGDKVSSAAEAAGCSAGTVVNEQRRIAGLISRATADNAERDAVLNKMVDLLYGEVDG